MFDPLEPPRAKASVLLPGVSTLVGSAALARARSNGGLGGGEDPAARHLARTVAEAERVAVDDSVRLPHWARLAPGPELAAELARLAEGPMADLDDAGRIELIAAYERMRGWVEAGQLAALADFAARRPVRGSGDEAISHPADAGCSGGTGSGPDTFADRTRADGEDPGPAWSEHGLFGARWVSEFAADEIGARLAWSRHCATDRLLSALDLAVRLPGTFTALRSGTIEPRKAFAVARATRPLEDQELIDAVEDRVLPEAPRLTVGQLIDRLRREVLALDPDGAWKRSELARTVRRVQIFAEEDAMATLRAQGPADAALAVYSCLDLMARHGCAPDDARTMDQRRYDALAWLVTTHPAIAGDSACSAGSAAQQGAGELSTAPASGTDPVTPASGTDPVTPASGTDPVALASGTDPVALASGTDPVALASGTDSRGFRMAGHHGVGSAGRMRPLVQLTVSEATMLYASQAPGHLAGYGPVCAEVARVIASDADWRRLLTDPVTGAVLAMDSATHDPPVSVAALVAARDRTCAFPTCRQRAETCDQDHVVPWPRGRTTPANLLSECRSHHRLKHLAGWSLTLRGGRWTWRSPTGHLYPLDPVAVGSAMDSIQRGATLALQEESAGGELDELDEFDDLDELDEPAELAGAR